MNKFNHSDIDIISNLVDQVYEVAQTLNVRIIHSRAAIIMEQTDNAVYRYYEELTDEMRQDTNKNP